MRAAAFALVAAACNTSSSYECTAADQCVEHGVQGICQAYCAFPDTMCDSGYRFEAHAGGGLANQCTTPVPVDAAIDVPIDVALPPIAFVQQNAAVVNTSTVLAAAFPGTVTAHDAIIATADFMGDGEVSIADSLGNTYQQVVGPSSAFGWKSYIFVAFDSRAGADTVTYTLTAVPGEFEIYIHEYAGISAFDTGAAASGSSTATDGMTSGTAETHAANELIFGFGVSLSGGAAAGTGFSARSTFHNNITEDEIVTSGGSYAATATMTSGTYWSMLMATFR